MASFAAHVIPGLIFAILGLYWSFFSIIMYIRTGHHTSRGSKTSNKDGGFPSHYYDPKRLAGKAWIPTSCLPRVPIEPFVKILLGSLGIAEEVLLGFDEKRRLMLMFYSPYLENGLLNVQGKFMHLTMYSVIVLSGVVDLFCLCTKLPKHLSIVIFSMVFYSESLLFYIHDINKHEFDSSIHFLLQFAIIPCGIFTLLRLYDPSNLMINLGFASCLTLQGTWLIQIGFLIFTDKFPLLDEGMVQTTTMFSAAIFVWHIITITVFNILLLLLLQYVRNRSNVLKRQTGNCFSRRFVKGGWKGMSEEKSQLIEEERKDSETEMRNIA